MFVRMFRNPIPFLHYLHANPSLQAQHPSCKVGLVLFASNPYINYSFLPITVVRPLGCEKDRNCSVFIYLEWVRGRRRRKGRPTFFMQLLHLMHRRELQVTSIDKPCALELSLLYKLWLDWCGEIMLGQGYFMDG